MFFCHSERSEESEIFFIVDVLIRFFASLRMTNQTSENGELYSLQCVEWKKNPDIHSAELKNEPNNVFFTLTMF